VKAFHLTAVSALVQKLTAIITSAVILPSAGSVARDTVASRSCCSKMPQPPRRWSVVHRRPYRLTYRRTSAPTGGISGGGCGDRRSTAFGLSKALEDIASIRGRKRLFAATPTQFNHTDTSDLGDLIAGILCGGRGGRSCLHSAALYGAVSVAGSEPRTPA
jgi:hypothetical protein